MPTRKRKRANASSPRRTPRETEVRIERIVPGGAGIGHAEGLTIFAPLTAPNDLVRAKIERVRGRIAFASLIEIKEPSPQRVEPPCPYFGRCGGCDFQQLNYQSQLAAKIEIVRDCFRRIGKIKIPDSIEITPSPDVWRYRSRARWQRDAAHKLLGYYELGSHRVVDIASCPVLAAPLERALEISRERMKANQLDENIAELQAAAGDGAVSIAVRRATSEASDVLEQTGAAEDENANVDFIAQDADADFMLHEGNAKTNAAPHESDETSCVIEGERYRFNADCFFQTNLALLPALISEALSGAHGRHALDLYCGVGLFTLPLARRFERVTGVEGSSVSVKFARRNLADARLTNARVVNSRVGEWLKGISDFGFQTADSESESQSSKIERRETQIEERKSINAFQEQSNEFQQSKIKNQKSKIDFVLLDPPRAGAEASTIQSLLRLRPPRIAYVSCDPATLARDAHLLCEGGYALSSVRLFDMFPQTHHVETIAHFQFDD